MALVGEDDRAWRARVSEVDKKKNQSQNQKKASQKKRKGKAKVSFYHKKTIARKRESKRKGK